MKEGDLDIVELILANLLEEKIDNEIVNLLIKKKGIKSAQDISHTLNAMYGKIIQNLLDEEFNEFMEYEKGSHISKKDVLGIWIDTTESTSKWYEIFEEIKDRGVEDIFFVSMDELTGLPETVEKVFPRIKDLQKNWSKGIFNWKNVYHELCEIFGERVFKYMEI